MRCPNCKKDGAVVLGSRIVGAVSVRRRRCAGCGCRFTTEEKVAVKKKTEPKGKSMHRLMQEARAFAAGLDIGEEFLNPMGSEPA